ncbi:MAG: DUF4864 domain-containing protein, partial [Burkholderiales bacterium]
LAASTIHFSALAAPVDDVEAEKVRGVIVAQLAALAEDDADGAFQTATPAVREAIGSSGRFLAMVRGSYPMVYRPSSVSFHKPEGGEGSVLQLVEITDGNDKSWIAMFALEQQPDNSWRISGCVVAENRWQSV